MNALTKKEKDMKKKEIELLEFEQTLITKTKQSDSLSLSLKTLNS